MNTVKTIALTLASTSVAITTIFHPIDRGFHGVQQLTMPDYLEASYVESVNYTPKEAVFTVFGKDAPLMWSIAVCESRGRQFDESGKIVENQVTHDVGLFQVNLRAHLDESNKLGYDIRTLNDNVAFAKVLFDAQGTNPWNSSSECWSPSLST